MKRKLCDAHRTLCSSELGRIVLVDIVLLLFIISSLAVIAFKWYQAQPKRAESQANWNSQIITQTPSRIGREGQTAQYWNLPGKAWQGLLAEGKAIGDWSKVRGLEDASVAQSDACQSAVVESQAGSGFSDASLPQKVLSGEIDFFIEPTGRRCFKRDQNLDLFFYSDVAGEPYVTHLGAVKILGVFVFSGEGMASRLSPWLKVAGLDPARFFEALDRAQHFLKSGRRSVTLLRLQAVEGKRPAIPSAHIVHTRLTSAKIKDFLSQAKRVRIIDLRGPQEVGENRITNAIETPYLVTSGQTKFDWRTTNQDTSFHKFEIAELLGTGRARNGVPIILVGDGPEDGRPIWALNVLNNVGVSHAFWFAEGASALKQAIAATNVTIDQ